MNKSILSAYCSDSLGAKKLPRNRKNQQEIGIIENKVGVLFSSTPIVQRKVMEFSFSNNGKIESAYDTDSGYISRSLDGGDLLVNQTFTHKSVYVSEDTLLEKPQIESSPSIINSSCVSTRSGFSGFDDSFSDNSLIIPPVPPIVCSTSGWKQRGDNKENVQPKTPQKRAKKPVHVAVSPDLFSDEEDVHVSPKKAPKERFVDKNDLKLLRNVQNGLSGVFPPPSVTIMQITVEEMLKKISENEGLFWREGTTNSPRKSLLIGGELKEVTQRSWPEIMESRHHGLHYNRSKLSEEFELLCNKYAQRYVGAETQSSCTLFEHNYTSPSKRKAIKQKWPAKSPGRRLSHLARRRITFSSANLQQASSCSILGARARQILVETKKLSGLPKRKSPRKTPSKSPFKAKKSLTPSSSAKKKLFRLRSENEENENLPCTSAVELSNPRRALFQSPDENRGKSLIFYNPGLPLAEAEKKATKRALFTSPPKQSPKKASPSKLFDRKRKRSSDSHDFNQAKMPKSYSTMEIRPQHIQSDMKRSVSESSMLMSLNMSRCEELSDIHKKKLQWAVYESLRAQNITPNHPNFKIYASVLARVTRKFLPSLAAKAPRPEEGTSERMLRIAKYHSYAVVKGKSVDEIINEYMKSRVKHQKPQGYVGLEEFNNMRNTRESVLQDRVNTLESVEKRKFDLNVMEKTKINDSKLERIRKVISFEDGDR